jgi:ribonuclease E
LHVLRSLEDTLLKGATHHLTIRTRTNVALYILNQKRAHLSEIEQRFGLTITVSADDTIANGAHFVIERGEPIEPRALAATSVTPASVVLAPEEEPEDLGGELEEDEVSEEILADAEPRPQHDGEREERGEDGQRRRRRRRGRGRGGEGRGEGRPAEHRNGGRPQPQRPAQQAEPQGEAEAGESGEREDRPQVAGELGPDGLPRKRRRGRRGGRRGRRGRPGENGHAGTHGESAAPADETQPTFGPGGYPSIASDYDEIDTTPTLDPEPGRQPPPRADVVADPYIGGDDIDTTPTVEPAPQRELPWRSSGATAASNGGDEDEIDTTPRDDEASPAETRPEPAEADDDPDRPKRSGWWQRKSFFG